MRFVARLGLVARVLKKRQRFIEIRQSEQVRYAPVSDEESDRAMVLPAQGMGLHHLSDAARVYVGDLAQVYDERTRGGAQR
jgi:hypothetical protein